MKAARSRSVICLLLAMVSSPASARCEFSQFSFFPDRNDTVLIQARTDGGQPCKMGFREGPGYHFTGAAFGERPPHGVLAKTGPTQFVYYPFPGYEGQDRYSLKLCAVVNGRKGCSTLVYQVDVR